MLTRACPSTHAVSTRDHNGPLPASLPTLLSAVAAKGIKLVKGDLAVSLEGEDGKVRMGGTSKREIACWARTVPADVHWQAIAFTL